jgi:hypothetical protein
VNFDVEARVFVLEEELHSFEDIELETFDVELHESGAGTPLAIW